MIAMDCWGSNQCAPFWSKVVATVSRSHGFQIQTFPRDNSQTNLTSIQLCVRRVKNVANSNKSTLETVIFRGGLLLHLYSHPILTFWIILQNFTWMSLYSEFSSPFHRENSRHTILSMSLRGHKKKSISCTHPMTS